MEFEVVALPGLGVGAVAGQQALLDRRELVMAETTRPSQSMSPAANDCASAWDSSSSRSAASLAQVLRRDRRDLEAALPFGDHQPLATRAG